jgi:hypothetical protein
MALNKIIKEDKIEIVGDYKAVQVRTATVIEEDGVELSRSFHRHLSQQSAEVQAICNAVHTPELIADWEAHLASQLEQIVNDESSEEPNPGE